MPRSSIREANLHDAAAALHRAFVLLRWAGPLPDPARKDETGPWVAWLGSAVAREEGARVLRAYRLALRHRFDEIGARVPVPGAPPPPVGGRGLLEWLLTARHARALHRWCREQLDDDDDPCAATVTGVALAAFHFPPVEALGAWFLLRWRLGWQDEAWPDEMRFLLVSGVSLPTLKRRLLAAGAPVAERSSVRKLVD